MSRALTALCAALMLITFVFGASGGSPRAARRPVAATPAVPPVAAATATPEASPTPSATPAAPSAVPPPASRPPAPIGTGVRWGLWEPGWQLADGGVDFSLFAHAESELGHRADLVHWYASWDEGWDTYDGGLVEQVAQSGRTPVITWEPTDRPLRDISDGKFDAYVDSWARGMAASAAGTIYLRIFHEFNHPLAGGGYGWGVGGGTGNQPADLVAAWRHIHDRFVTAGARNVRFVWCPDGVDLGAGLLQASYPGDGYVDFACWDTYDYDLAGDYQALSQVTQKPLLLAEVGARSPASIRVLAASLGSGRYDRIRAVIWFDEGEWRLDARPDVLEAARAMLAGSAFS